MLLTEFFYRSLLFFNLFLAFITNLDALIVFVFDVFLFQFYLLDSVTSYHIPNATIVYLVGTIKFLPVACL